MSAQPQPPATAGPAVTSSPPALRPTTPAQLELVRRWQRLLRADSASARTGGSPRRRAASTT